MSKEKLTRRDFLKLSGLSFPTTILPKDFLNLLEDEPFNPNKHFIQKGSSACRIDNGYYVSKIFPKALFYLTLQSCNMLKEIDEKYSEGVIIHKLINWLDLGNYTTTYLSGNLEFAGFIPSPHTNQHGTFFFDSSFLRQFNEDSRNILIQNSLPNSPTLNPSDYPTLQKIINSTIDLARFITDPSEARKTYHEKYLVNPSLKTSETLEFHETRTFKSSPNILQAASAAFYFIDYPFVLA